MTSTFKRLASTTNSSNMSVHCLDSILPKSCTKSCTMLVEHMLATLTQ